MRKGNQARVEKIIQAKIANRFDHPREDETKRENQGDAVMRAAEAHQGIGGITKAEERAAHFEIEIRCWCADNMGVAGIEHRAKKKGQEQPIGDRGQPATVLAEKPGDFCPIPQDYPQSPEKTGRYRGNARPGPFLTRKINPEVIVN